MIYVVGAVCFDVITERDSYIRGTSNPSHITARLGGVAYNIFSHLHGNRRLVTALGDDMFSGVVERSLRNELRDPGEAIILRTRETAAPFYVSIMEAGETLVAASQMDAAEAGLTSEAVSEQLQDAGRGDVVVIDANLSVSTVRTLIERLSSRTTLVFEPISVGKVERHLEILRGLTIMTPDELEFGALFGTSPQAVEDNAVYEYLEVRNISGIMRTRGAAGTTLYIGRERIDFPPYRTVRTGDTTGAGDMLTALLAEAIHESARRGSSEVRDILVTAIPQSMKQVEAFLQRRGESNE